MASAEVALNIDIPQRMFGAKLLLSKHLDMVELQFGQIRRLAWSGAALVGVAIYIIWFSLNTASVVAGRPAGFSTSLIQLDCDWTVRAANEEVDLRGTYYGDGMA